MAITKGAATTFVDMDNDVNVVKPPTPSLGWSKDGQYVLLSDGWDIWRISAKDGTSVNLTVNGKKDKIRYRQRFRLDPDEKGIDLDQPQYIGAYGEWTKKSGIGILEPGRPGVRMVQWGDARYVSLLKAKGADTYLYTRETVKESPDYYLTGKALENGAEGNRHQSAAEGLSVDQRRADHRLHFHARREIAGRALPSSELRSLQEVSGDGRDLREDVAERECVSAADL